MAAAVVAMQPAEEAFAFAAIAGRGASRGARDLASDFLADPLAAVDRFLAGDAHANGAGGLAGHRTTFVNRALLNAILGHALVDANLLFFPHIAANVDLALDGLGIADLLADGHGALFIFRAVDPDFASASRAAGVVAAIVVAATAVAATAVAMTGEEAAAVAEQRAHFLAFPVTVANKLLLHARLLNVLVAGLVDGPFLAHVFLVANLAGFPGRNHLLHAHGPFTLHRDAFPLAGVVLFGTTLDLVHRPFDRNGFLHPFVARHRAECGGRRRGRRATGITTTRRPEIRTCGRNRHGGNGANQQSQTKRLAHHAFSLVIHADPVLPVGHARWDWIDR